MNRIEEKNLLKIFQLKGTPAEQKELNKLLEEILATKSGKQLLKEIRKKDYSPKPIQLEFVPQEKIDGSEGSRGQTNAEKGIITLDKINPDKPLDNLMMVSILAHELYHLKNGEIFIPLLRKSSIVQKVYNHLTNEACTYAFEACVFEKELMVIHPEYKSTCEFSHKEFIEHWMHGRINRLAQNYVNKYAERFSSWLPPVKEKEFMDQMAKFQQRETAIPLESFPWYKPSKSGGCYIIGTKAILEMDEQGAPVFRCIYVGDRKFSSIVYSREQRKTEEGTFIPARDLCTIGERPALPAECALVRDYFEGKVSKDKLPDLKNMSLPKEIDNMTDIVAWRESFIPDKPVPTASPKRVIRKINTHE